MHSNDKMSFHVDNMSNDMIRITENFMDRVYTSYINLRESAIREALIKAGWTPPNSPVKVLAGQEFALGNKVFRWTVEGRMERVKAG